LNWRYARDAVLPRRADDEEFAVWEEAETARWLERQSRTSAGGTNMHPVMEKLGRRYGLLPATMNAPATNVLAAAP
ncbi:MAG TPA: hypothetical protein PKE47_00440, partial [Verrucomicrobiota bacterium]|nr:hypothetical protein [Verrucomicrobiota bacterium]